GLDACGKRSDRTLLDRHWATLLRLQRCGLGVNGCPTAAERATNIRVAGDERCAQPSRRYSRDRCPSPPRRGTIAGVRQGGLARAGPCWCSSSRTALLVRTAVIR